MKIVPVDVIRVLKILGLHQEIAIRADVLMLGKPTGHAILCVAGFYGNRVDVGGRDEGRVERHIFS